MVSQSCVRVHLAEALVALNLGPLTQLGLRCQQPLVVVGPTLLLAAPHAIERRLRNVDIPIEDELLQVAIEEGQEQGADVTAVHIRVGHENDAVIAELA